MGRRFWLLPAGCQTAISKLILIFQTLKVILKFIASSFGVIFYSLSDDTVGDNTLVPFVQDGPDRLAFAR